MSEGGRREEANGVSAIVKPDIKEKSENPPKTQNSRRNFLRLAAGLAGLAAASGLGMWAGKQLNEKFPVTEPIDQGSNEDQPEDLISPPLPNGDVIMQNGKSDSNAAALPPLDLNDPDRVTNPQPVKIDGNAKVDGDDFLPMVPKSDGSSTA